MIAFRTRGGGKLLIVHHAKIRVGARRNWKNKHHGDANYLLIISVLGRNWIAKSIHRAFILYSSKSHAGAFSVKKEVACSLIHNHTLYLRAQWEKSFVTHAPS